MGVQHLNGSGSPSPMHWGVIRPLKPPNTKRWGPKYWLINIVVVSSLYMCRVPIHGKTSRTWEDFPRTTPQWVPHDGDWPMSCEGGTSNESIHSDTRVRLRYKRIWLNWCPVHRRVLQQQIMVWFLNLVFYFFIFICWALQWPPQAPGEPKSDSAWHLLSLRSLKPNLFILYKPFVAMF